MGQTLLTGKNVTLRLKRQHHYRGYRAIKILGVNTRSIVLAPVTLLLAATLATCYGNASSAHSARPLSVPDNITIPPSFTIQAIASVPRARELVALPNGDLIAGSLSNQIYILRDAEAARPRRATVLATLPDDRASGVAFSRDRGELYVGTEHGVYAARYATGQSSPVFALLAGVRTGPISPNSDGDVHLTTSVAYAGGALYAGVGSSCNACVEADPTRASILRIAPSGTIVKRATRIRNAIAMTGNLGDDALWAGGAGQDSLPYGHPYEFLDDVSSHRGVADYGWPDCEENRHAYTPGADCSQTVAPLVVLPAYSTIIAATFYPTDIHARYSFPSAYRGAIFATAHGSWHRAPDGDYAAAPQVVAIPMSGGRPKIPVDWQNPQAQWQTFVGGFQHNGERSGRPTGIAVGVEGSLFVADDQAGVIYRIRPK